MTVHNMRETFIRENSLYTLLDIEELLGKRLLWDLSSIWFRFNVKFPRHIWARIKAAKGLRARQIVIAMEFLKSQNIHVEVSPGLNRKTRSNGYIKNLILPHFDVLYLVTLHTANKPRIQFYNLQI